MLLSALRKTCKKQISGSLVLPFIWNFKLDFFENLILLTKINQSSLVFVQDGTLVMGCSHWIPCRIPISQSSQLIATQLNCLIKSLPLIYHWCMISNLAQNGCFSSPSWVPYIGELHLHCSDPKRKSHEFHMWNQKKNIHIYIYKCVWSHMNTCEVNVTKFVNMWYKCGHVWYTSESHMKCPVHNSCDFSERRGLE